MRVGLGLPGKKRRRRGGLFGCFLCFFGVFYGLFFVFFEALFLKRRALLLLGLGLWSFWSFVFVWVHLLGFEGKRLFLRGF